MLPPWLKGRRPEFPYSDVAIQCLLVIDQASYLPLRVMCRLGRSVLRRKGMDLVVPSYTQVCWGQQRLEVAIPRSPRLAAMNMMTRLGMPNAQPALTALRPLKEFAPAADLTTLSVIAANIPWAVRHAEHRGT